jgi:hypothetical protein
LQENAVASGRRRVEQPQHLLSFLNLVPKSCGGAAGLQLQHVLHALRLRVNRGIDPVIRTSTKRKVNQSFW